MGNYVRVTDAGTVGIVALVAVLVLAAGATGLAVASDDPGVEGTSTGIGADSPTADRLSPAVATDASDGDTGATSSEADGENDTATISSEVLDGDGTETVIVYFGAASDGVQTNGDSTPITADRLKSTAENAQEPLDTYAAETPGVTVDNSFWLGNLAAVTVDHSQANVEALADIEGVEHVGPNREVEIETTTPDAQQPAPAAPAEPAGLSYPSPQALATADEQLTASSVETTYGLQQINAPDVWSRYDTEGEGATVAVLDTGVDADHPDIDLSRWAEFDSEGNQVDTEPNDGNGHGTHVSGTVAGGNASGTYIGVAPGIDLYHAKVLEDDGSGTFAQIVAGMEWAVDNDADVISMSLGAPGYFDEFIDPVRNAESAGTMVIASSGNDGEGNSSSPGNVYDATSVGASDANEDIASFSSGEQVDTVEDWGASAKADWPSEYIVPTISAPGVAVNSSVPGGGYDEKQGTSMAAPHVSGAVALMHAAASEDPTNDEVRSALIDTAFKPDGWNESDANASIDGQDSRYGHGIIDVSAATDQVATPANYTVTIDATNEPIAAGEQLNVTATIANTGDETGTQTITLETNGTVRDSIDLAVAGGENETVTLSWVTESGDSGEYTAVVNSENGTDSVDVFVEAGDIVNYANEDDVVDTRGLRSAVGDWQAGDLSSATLQDVLQHWSSGEPVQ